MTNRKTDNGLRVKREVIRDLGPKLKADGIRGGKKKKDVSSPPPPTYFPS